MHGRCLFNVLELGTPSHNLILAPHTVHKHGQYTLSTSLVKENHRRAHRHQHPHPQCAGLAETVQGSLPDRSRREQTTDHTTASVTVTQRWGSQGLTTGTDHSSPGRRQATTLRRREEERARGKTRGRERVITNTRTITQA